MEDSIQEDIDRLTIIISNFVGVHDIGYDALVALEPLFDQLKPTQNLRPFWNERFNRAKTTTKKFA